MKLNEAPQIMQGPYLLATITDLFRATAKKVNAMASGSAAAFDNAAVAPPAAGVWAQGDYVKNSSVAELGTVGNKYTIQGWSCTAGGSPGTWVQVRAPTGN